MITRVRVLASLGAGGVIYLTPMAFNQFGFDASQIGVGIAIAALVGTFSRFLSGFLLDSKVSCSFLIGFSCLFTLLADFSLVRADEFSSYLLGQLLIGFAAGIYWPAAELAVSLSCDKFSSRRGYALVRSADALGMALGALLGTIGAIIGFIRLVYFFDAICMISLLYIFSKSKLAEWPKRERISFKENKYSSISPEKPTWYIALFPILVISLVATGIFAMLQSTLPLDMVRGGLERPPLSEAVSGSIISIQLFLLVIFQWPLGRWLADRKIRFGLVLSLLCLGFGCFLVAFSALFKNGVFIIFFSQVFFSIGLAAFLPTATQAVIDLTPANKRGLSIAIFSQCFAITALLVPLFSGWFLDTNSHAFHLWLIMSLLCMSIITFFFKSLNYQN